MSIIFSLASSPWQLLLGIFSLVAAQDLAGVSGSGMPMDPRERRSERVPGGLRGGNAELAAQAG